MIEMCGTMVVRKPEFAFTETFRINRTLGSKEYRGVDRLAWRDLDNLFYRNLLSKELVSKREELVRLNNDISGINLTFDIPFIEAVVALNPRESEAIGIWSKELSMMKGGKNLEIQYCLLGIDCVAIGEWSLIAAGIFCEPSEFSEFVPQLNENGLFDTQDRCLDLIAKYDQLSESEIVEPLAPTSIRSAVKIYRIAV